MLLGAATGWAVAVGSWWWLAPVAVAVALSILLRWTPSVPGALLLVAICAASGAAVGALGYDNHLAGAANSALAAGLLCGVVLAVVAVRATQRLQRRELAQERELTRSLTAERDAHIAGALAEERSALAGQIHDRLGHRLTLSTVRLGRLGIDPDLTPDQRRIIETVRDETADITAELGSLVQLLDRGTRPEAPLLHAPAEIVAAAREAGVPISADLAGLSAADPRVVAVLAGVLEETVANAARHAPGQPVEVTTSRDGDATIMIVTNGVDGPPGSLGSGSGLARVRERLDRVGGDLGIRTAEGRFTVRASMP